MEFSSPLAAMQPRPQRGFGCGAQDISVTGGIFSNTSVFASNNFNFKDMSMKKSGTDYFTLKPFRGSSPAASLAADLSQNFHIDQSPQLPTPRRSLFTANVLHSRVEGITTPPICQEGVTTPPIPSSSPSYGNDSMDISPLPHKAPFSFVTKLNAQSRLPNNTIADEDMLSICSPPTNNPLLEVPKPLRPIEQRKPTFRRPSLSRTKGFSTNTVSLRPDLENHVPAFTFDAGKNGSTDSPSSTSLADCFVESPVQTKTFVNHVLGPPRPRQSFFNVSHIARSNGSPCQIQPRKPQACMGRPRKQFRRSLSMFEHPDDVMKRDKAEYKPCGLQSIMDIDDTHELQLPHFFPADEPDSLPRIQLDTLISIIDGQYCQNYDNILVVDCRFEYEFQGGHIQGATNHNDKEVLANQLFSPSANDKTLLIFHCEYSVHRAPIMAKFIRQRDRAVNENRYPHLTYPETYILEGGYSSFFKAHQTRCFPQNYVEMDAKEYEHACEKGMNKLRQRGKLGRAHTFAASRSSYQDDSPISQGRAAHGSSLQSATFDDSFDSRKLRARRMASY